MIFKSKLDPDGEQKREHVWDPQKNRMVATISGTLDTEDPVVIEALTRLGYVCLDALVETPTEPTTFASLPVDKDELVKPKKRGR
jgi:hypothetical protein